MTRQVVASRLSTVPTRHTKWLFEHRIPLRTGCIFAGQGGIAKSTIISSLIAKATLGLLPGSFEGIPVRVGMISPEDDIESVLVPRLIAAGADLDMVSYLSVQASDGNRSWTTLPNIADDLPAMGETIAGEEIRLLVVDPLVSIMSGNSISQSDVRRNFDPLSALAKEHEFALLAVAHFGKSGERAGDRLSGSHAFRDIARVVMVAAVDEETGLRVVTVDKSNYSPEKPSDAYSIESVDVRLDDGFTQSIGHAVSAGESAVTVQEILDRERDTSVLSADSQRIIAEVAKHPDGIDAESIAKGLGIFDAQGKPDIAKVRTYLNRAANRGDIERVRRGHFAPVSRVSNVMSVSDTKHSTQIQHISYRDTCPVCRTELHPALIAAGQNTHPNCAELDALAHG